MIDCEYTNDLKINMLDKIGNNMMVLYLLLVVLECLLFLKIIEYFAHK